MLVASALLIASSSTGLEGGVFYAFGLLTFTGVYLTAYPFLYRRCLITRITALAEDLGTQGVLGSITLVLEEETLTEITSVTRTEARWSSMHSVEVVGDYTFIMVTPMTAAILPRRAFPSDEVYNQVKEFALARIGGA